MGLGVSLFLIAVGAILAFAVDTAVAGVDIWTIGVILMVVGIIGLLLSLLFWSSFMPWAARPPAGAGGTADHVHGPDTHTHDAGSSATHTHA